MFQALGNQLRKPSGLLGRIVARMMDIRNREFYEKTIAALGIKSGEKVYEIGFGPGLGISLIATSTSAGLVSGIDFSELMYQKATKRNKKFIDKGLVRLRYGDLLTADMADEKYHKVFCVNVIYFWSDLNAVFDKVYSVLKDGGRFCIFMTPVEAFERLKFTNDFCKYSVEEVERELKKAGFERVEYQLNKGYYIQARK